MRHVDTAKEKANPETGELPKEQPDSKGDKPRDSNTALATDGERKLITNRARSNNLDILDMIDRAGLTGLDPDLSGLTKDGFVALKDLLPKAA